MDITLSLGVLLGWETSSEGETISFYFSEGLMLIIEKVYFARENGFNSLLRPNIIILFVFVTQIVRKVKQNTI